MSVLAKPLTVIPGTTDVADRIQALDWGRILEDLYARGSAMLKQVISHDKCRIGRDVL